MLEQTQRALLEYIKVLDNVYIMLHVVFYKELAIPRGFCIIILRKLAKDRFLDRKLQLKCSKLTRESEKQERYSRLHRFDPCSSTP